MNMNNNSMDMEKIIIKYDEKGFEKPIAKKKLLGWESFAASFAGENVAGTEFVIGATFVSWGVSAESVIYGLLIGNLLAVLNWYFICTPIAVDQRITLYGYLKKITGPNMTKIYNILNAILFCVLSGAMITVSASAIRVLLNLEPQLNWYPTSMLFVLIVLIVGFIVSIVAVLGFKGVANFAKVCSPWLLIMFIAGAFVMMPTILQSLGVDSISSFSEFMKVGNDAIWIEKPDGVGFWNVAAFAWVCNLAVNAGLSDMAVFRYAKNNRVGATSAIGMLLGHYVAWIAAGIMGVGTAIILKTTIGKIDPGSVAVTALGISGILAVILAGWTTSNPSLYRAGLAFQTLFPKVSIRKVTFITGILTSIIACFPFVFTKLLDFVGYMGILLAPVGAIVVAEHWIFPKIGYTRYWSSYKNQLLNYPAIITWIASIIFSVSMDKMGIIGLFFLFVPVYVFSMILYIFLAGLFGAKEDFTVDIKEDNLYSEYILQKVEEEGDIEISSDLSSSSKILCKILISVSITCLLIILGMSVSVYFTPIDQYVETLAKFKTIVLIPTLIYFIASTWNVSLKNKTN